MPNTVTPEQFKALRTRFAGSLSSAEAMETLRTASRDPDAPPIVRLHAASAMIELSMGRSVQSTMARLRRATGLDKPKPPRGG